MNKHVQRLNMFIPDILLQWYAFKSGTLGKKVTCV